MNRTYSVVSPSLRDVLSHAALAYEGIDKPLAILRVLDGPASRGSVSETVSERRCSGEEAKVLETYFLDLLGIFMKKLSHLVVDTDISHDESIKMQAMLQEMIKVKNLMRI